MSDAVNFTVNNGADTPVPITFKPESISGGNAVYRDDTGGVSVLMPRIKINVSLPSANRPTSRTTLNFTFPVAKTVDGVDVVDHVLRADVSFVSSDRSLRISRKHILAIVTNSLSDAFLKEVITEVSPILG